MKKLGFVLIGSAALALAACNNSNPDQVNNVEANTDMTVNDTAVNEQSQAVNAEAEALGNQAAELNQTSSTSGNAANAATSASNSDNAAAEVNAM